MGPALLVSTRLWLGGGVSLTRDRVYWLGLFSGETAWRIRAGDRRSCTWSGKGKCVAWKKGTSRGRSRSSRAGLEWQPKLSKKRDFIPIMFPVSFCNTALLTERKGIGKRHSQDPIEILGTIAEPTGTDGCRVLCHQFYTSSLLLSAHCIKGFSTFFLRMKRLQEALLLS